MRVLLLVAAFDGLSQRAWCALREAGHDVGVLLTSGSPGHDGLPNRAEGSPGLADAVAATHPDLVLCPSPGGRIPLQIRRRFRTVTIHPGPVGDRGPSPLDWAITESAGTWGVTAVQVVEDRDPGLVWATRVFTMPAAPPRKSSLRLGPVADAAMECIFEVLAKAADPAFVPGSAAEMTIEVQGARPRPAMTQADRAFDWTEPTEHILRRIRAADGAPGVRTEVAGLAVHAYDAHLGVARGRPGALIGRRQGAVLVGTGDGSVWLGHLRPAKEGGLKLPATTLLGRHLRGVPNSPLPVGTEPEGPSYRQVRYRRTGAVGWLAFDFYNGAMSAGHCRRLLAAFRHAAAQDTQVLVLRGGTDAFSNGQHLTVVDAAADPAAAAWVNTRAFNAVCREIITCTRQVVISAYAGSAAAAGAMLGLGADLIAARQGVVLNPYYDIGLYGSELHTFTLPRRVGSEAAQRLIDTRLPVSAEQAASLGLVDEVGPRHPEQYAEWLTALALRESDPRAARKRQAAKARRLAAERVPLDAYEARELAEMSADLFGDRSGFTAARRAFVAKEPATVTPARLALRPVASARPRQVGRPRTAADTEVQVRSSVPLPA
ncbi:MAG: enoyl-CoA hydratase-related protein [Actinoplanes sp.]